MKFSLIPKQTNSQPSPIHTSQSVPVIPPTYPHPPRPVSYSQNMNMEDGFVVVRPSPEPPVNPSGESTDFYSTTLNLLKNKENKIPLQFLLPRSGKKIMDVRNTRALQSKINLQFNI